MGCIRAPRRGAAGMNLLVYSAPDAIIPPTYAPPPHTHAGGCEVVRVGVEEEAELLRMALTEALSRPHKTLQYWLVGDRGGEGRGRKVHSQVRRTLWIHRPGTCLFPVHLSCIP